MEQKRLYLLVDHNEREKEREREFQIFDTVTNKALRQVITTHLASDSQGT